MAMNTEDSLREYLRLFVKVPLVGRIGPLARTFDFVADAAPGVKEILSVGKLAYEVRERHYDLVVVDAEASGHIVAQIGAPRVISELVQVGLVRDQTAWMLEILEDPAATGLVVVTTPEEMPVTETIDLVARLERETGVDAVGDRRQPRPAGAVRPPPGRGVRPARSDELERAARRRRRARGAPGARRGPRHRGSPPRSAAGTSSGCGPASPPDLPVLYVPELFTRATGRRVVALVAEALAEELDVTLMAPRRATPVGLDALLGQQGDGARLRLGRRRQDDDRGRARRWRRPSTRAGGCSC